MMPVLLAVAASTTLGIGVALQHEAAAGEPGLEVMDPRLLGRLIRRRKWLTGMGIGFLGAALQATAIATGPLLLVAPIFALHVGVALAFATWRTGRRLEDRHWWALGAAVVGLAGFLVVAAPETGDGGAASVWWAVPIGAVAVGAVLARLRARHLPPATTALLLATVAGLGFGTSDGLIKLMSEVGDQDGWSAVLSHWALPAWALASTTSFWLSQSAHHAADITASLPATSTLQPTVGALLGAAMFGETLRAGVAVPLEVLFVGLLAAGVLVLARTPLPQPRVAEN